MSCLKDFEAQTPAHSSSPESQSRTAISASSGMEASTSPIDFHSFDLQLMKETTLLVLDRAVTSGRSTILSLKIAFSVCWEAVAGYCCWLGYSWTACCADLPLDY